MVFGIVYDVHWQLTDLTPTEHTADASAHRLIHGTGTMADRIRAHAWSTTSLGPVDTWPAELLTTLNLALATAFPFQIFWGPDMIILHNDALSAFVQGKDAIGRPAREVWAEVWDAVGPQLQSVFDHGRLVSVQHVPLSLLQHGVSVPMYFDYTYTPIVSAAGVVMGILNFAQDVTETVRAQIALHASEAQASRVLQSIGDAVIVTDAAGAVTRMNPVAEALTGWPEREAQGQQLDAVFDIVNESTRERAESPADKVRRTGKIVGLANHTVLTSRSGTETAIDDSGAPIRDEQGNLTGVVLVFRDIDERRRAERELALIARRQAVLVDLYNSQRNVTDPNVLMENTCALIGRKLKVDRVGFFDVLQGELRYSVGWSGSDALPVLHGAQPAAFVGAALADLARAGSTIAIDDVRTDGLTQDSGFEAAGVLSTLGAPFTREGAWIGGFYAQNGQPRAWTQNEVYFFRQVADATWAAVERLRSTHALSQSEERFRTTFQNAPIGIAVTRLDGSLIDFNPAYERLAGHTREQLLNGGSYLELTHPDDIVANHASVQQLIDGQTPVFTVEKRYVHADGTPLWVRVNGTLLRDEHGRPEFILGIVEDIDNRRKTEAALIQNEKLAAVGRLAASIAHEINNPLESVTNLMYLARHSEALDEAQEYLDTAERELRRVSAITNQTLRFHRQSTAPTPTFCTDLFSDTLSIYQGRLVNSQIEVRKRKRAERAVNCLSGEIRQVLSNLIGNAIDSMASGGTLYVRSREATNWRNGLQGIVLTIADTGTGISAEVQKRIFDAFFTTKGIGGTGLGLWISAEIIARHHGALRLRSKQGPLHHGTVFTVFLPFAGPLLLQ